MTTADVPAHLGALAHTLWREQHLLEACLYRMECQHLLAEVGRSRWREQAAADVELDTLPATSPDLARRSVALVGPFLGVPTRVPVPRSPLDVAAIAVAVG